MNPLLNSAKIYKAEMGRLRKTQSDKYYTLRLISFFPAWYRCLRRGSSPLQDKIPWITFGAIRFLKRLLTKEMVVYEFGSGGSTLFFANRVKRVYSVEHDEKWFQKLTAAVKKEGYLNWSGQVIKPTIDDEFSNKNPSDPDAYISGSPDYRGYSFKNYVESICRFPDSYFDLVLIDGRARPSCFKAAYSKIKPGGHIVWDNTDRKYYLESIDRIQGNSCRTDFPGPGPYVDFFTQTSIWLKPNTFRE
jgi:hypothetical protein